MSCSIFRFESLVLEDNKTIYNICSNQEIKEIDRVLLLEDYRDMFCNRN